MYERRPGGPRIPHDVIHADFDTKAEAEAALSEFRKYNEEYSWIETIQADDDE
jgi:hypothetical protein